MLVGSPAGTRPAGGVRRWFELCARTTTGPRVLWGGGPLGEPNLQQAWVRKL